MESIISYGHNERTTHSTVANDSSSRSHAICQIQVKNNKKILGKLILCDLAVYFLFYHRVQNVLKIHNQTVVCVVSKVLK